MLRVKLLGEVAAEADGTRLDPPDSRRAWALLAWLALNPGMHSRGRLASLFWPDVLDSSARASLRSAVWALRRALGDDADRWLVTTRDGIGLSGDGEVTTDVAEFNRLLASGQTAEAVVLADGDLLADIDDDWAIELRDAHRDRLSVALGRLASEARAAGDLEAAVAWSRRRLALDPLSEEAGRTLIECIAAAGDRAGALATYDRLRERWAQELEIAPSPRTRELVDAIRAGEVEVAPPPAPARVPKPTGPPLVGREEPLAALMSALDAARAGNGRAVLIRGEPGIGKTRLAAELLSRAAGDGAVVASGAALDVGAGAPFGLWAEVVRELSRALPPPPPGASWPGDVSRLAPGLGTGATRDPHSSPELERARLFEGIVQLMEWASSERPLVLLLEDVHAADSASLELTAYVARRAGSLPILTVLTRRDEPQRPETRALEHELRSRGRLVAELWLGPLGEDALRELVAGVAELPEDEVERVLAAAEGNALLAVEGARAVASGERSAPASLRVAVHAALQHVPEESLPLAEVAAVASREVQPHEAGLGGEEFAEAATRLAQTGLFSTRPGAIGYRHALLGEAVYEEIPEPRRSWLHRSLAERLSDQGARLAAEAALHFRLAGCDREAVGQLVIAAVNARDIGALAEAAAFLEQAAGIAPDDGRVYLELAEVEAWRSRREPSNQAFERALDLMREADPHALARAWLRRGRWMHGALCYPAEALDCFHRTLELLDAAGSEDVSARAEALAGSAWAESTAGDVDKVDDLLMRLHELIGRASGSELQRHDIAEARGIAAIRRGRWEESYAHLTAGGEAARRAGRPDMSYTCWANASCAAACSGDFERSLEFADRGLAEIAGLLPSEVHMHAARAFILLRLGRTDEALAACEAQRLVAEQFDLDDLSAQVLYDNGMVAIACGDWERGEKLLAEALQRDMPASRPLARLARAEALVRLGRLNEAERELRETALEPVSRTDFPDTLVARLTRVQGLIAAARGDHELARKRLLEAAEGWQRRTGAVATGESYVANLVDLGRPPVQGLVEPQRELDRLLAEIAELEAVTTQEV
jgi:DNA-binding SARP family transcriptional activator/tetratricopeptide (TPR) repeat protein